MTNVSKTYQNAPPLNEDVPDPDSELGEDTRPESSVFRATRRRWLNSPSTLGPDTNDDTIGYMPTHLQGKRGR